MKNIVKRIIFSKIQTHLNNSGMTIENISFDIDLLKSGIIDSLTLVELIVELGQVTGINITNLLDEEEELLITINWFFKKFDVKQD